MKHGSPQTKGKIKGGRTFTKLPYSPLNDLATKYNSRKKILLWLAKISAGILILGLLIIKFDSGLAATIADSILRPLLGNTLVADIEKAYFNTADRIQKIEYTYKKPDSPILAQPAQNSQVIKSNSNGLDLATLPLSFFPSLTGEGQWENYSLSQFPNSQVLAHTFLRPDSSRSYAFTTVVEANMHLLRLASVAGLTQPGGPVGKPGPGVVPSTVVNSGNLVAAFDGGFEYRDGQYGMVVGSTTYVPMVNNIATLVSYKDGTINIVKYTGVDSLGKNVMYARQNCPMLLENGVVGTVDPANKSLWGRTLTSDIYTWRTGVGITKAGNLLFAVGNNLTPTTLALALKDAGAVNAMQLDINPHWVRFNIFDRTSSNTYTSSTLMKGIVDGSSQFLHGYDRDFFYLYKK